MTRFTRLISFGAAAVIAAPAYAGVVPPVEVPEPGIAALLATAAIGIAIARSRRK